MSKISTYEVAPVPKLADKLIGTSVGGEIEDVTYNFTLQELLDVFLPVIPANNLQGVLDYGNTATQDINLIGTITTTNLDVTDTANFLNSYFVGDTHIQGGLFDSEDSIGLAGQVLTSTGEFVEWVTLPPIFTPNLQQVLEEGNTSTTGIILDAGLEALDVDTDTATINTNITIDGTITDGDASVGAAGTVLSSTVTGVKWVALPVYSATSPLLFNSATGVFSIQQANGSQSGFLSSSDWINFNGKQNAGNYITALTGEATASGPGSATVTLSNAAVIGKVLTGFNPTAGTINASDSILTAFGKTQSQINALVGGVIYQGTWNASANVPTLTSSVGVQGHYYIVNVAGNTNLNGITDWKVGDWAIFSESVWQKVDNTESVSSVNGFTGAVELTTDNIPEGTTNLYFLNSRARLALSFLPGSGAYDNTSGAITIPTNNNQILNGAGYITLSSLSATAPLTYNNLTGAFGIPKATTLVDGYLSATDWTTFNGKQNYLGGTGLVKSTAGTISYITDNSTNWNTAYDRSIVSAAVTGTTTKTLTLNEQDGGTITASWTDLDTGLTSVGVSMPSAFSVANSPLTSNGTIAITGAGTNLQYIDGTGALQTFPGLTGFVPYTGATANVDLGTFGLISDYLRLNITPSSIPTTAGTMSWNNTDGTLDIRLKGGNVTLQVGEETVVRVVNKSGVDLLEANYQVVRVRNEAEGGAQGQRLAVVLARANTKVNHTGLLGIVTETINSNQEGFVTNFGIVRDIDTTGDLQGETWADGDVLWLSETTAGALTNIEPTTHPIQIGYVIYAHANNGKIFVYLQEGVDELDELHDVSITSVANNQGLFYDSATSLWKNKSIATALGYTPADAATLISTTAPLSGGGDLSANRTFSISQSGAASDGYLSSTDWNTFNNKQPSGSYVPTSRQLTINGTAYDLSADRVWSVGTVTSVAALTLGTTGTDLSSTVANSTTTPVITLNVPTASAANRGALSAADWSTFNTKVGSVTASSPLASSGGSTPNITIQQSSGSQDGYLSSTDWTTFNNKQTAGNYITSLTGEATATGPGAAAVTLNNASVTAKVLTGINITGGTVQATDTMLTAFGKLQNQINGLIGSTIYQGTWNASTNTPALASGVGVRGYYYIVSVAGNTNLDGITDWFVGDWAIFDGTAWQQVDNTDAVVSVNGQTGAVSLTTDNIPEGATNQYYLDSRARAALSFTAGSGAYNSTTGVITIPTNTNQLTNGASFITLASLSGTAPIQYNNTTGAISITQAGTASNGFLSSTDWNTFNNKQGALTNPVTGTGNNNYIAKFSSTGSTIANSLLQSDASNVFINQENTSFGVDAQALIRLGFVKKSGVDPTIAYADVPFTISSTTGTSIAASNTFVTRLSIALNGAATFSSSIAATTATFSGRVNAGEDIALTRTDTNFGYITRPNTVGYKKIGFIVNGGGNLTNFEVNSDISQFSGNIGVGVTPSAWTSPFNVIQLGSYGQYLGGQSNGPDIKIGSNHYYNGTNYIYTTSSSAVQFNVGGVSGFQFNVADVGVAGGAVTFTTAMTVNRNGNVGIGTNNPSGAAGLALVLNSGASQGRICIKTSATGDASGDGLQIVMDGVEAAIEQRENAALTFATNATERLRITNNGYLLIGTQVSLQSNEKVGIETDTNTALIAKFTGGAATGWAAKFWNNATSGDNLIIEFLTESGITSRGSIRYDRGGDRLNILGGGSGLLFTGTSSYTSSIGIGVTPVVPTGVGKVLQIGNTTIVQSVVGSQTLFADNVYYNGSAWKYITSNFASGIRIGALASGEFSFHSAPSGTAGNTITNWDTSDIKMVIKTNGYAGFGTSTPLMNFNVAIPESKTNTGVFSTAFFSTSTTLDGNPFGLRIGLGGGASIGARIATLQTTDFSLADGGSIVMQPGGGNVLINTTTGVSGGGSLQVNGNVNINGVFQINGVTIGGGGGSGVTGSGTTNYVPKWTGSSSLGNSVIQDTGTNVGIGAAPLSFTRLYVTDTGANIIGGNAIAGTSIKGVMIENSNNADESIGLWFRTGNNHLSGISGQRFNSSTGWGTDLRFYTHEEVTTDLTYTRERMRITTEGSVLIGTRTDVGSGYKLQVAGSINMSYASFFNFRGSSGAGDVLVDNSGSTLRITGNVTVAGSVTATGGFFDTSDSRLKIVITDNHIAKGIGKVAAKFYVKNGKRELGYFAQDLQEILPSAVGEATDGFLTLSYSQVHTAKIAVIEDEVTILKNRVSDLESKLLKYEA